MILCAVNHYFWGYGEDCVVPPGLEPGQTEPESVVLPLHNGTIFGRGLAYKSNCFFTFSKNKIDSFL